MSLLQVTIKRSDFFILISKAYGLIEKRVVMPILSKVLITAKENRLFVLATDQDNCLQSYVPAQVKSEGQVVVDTQTLYDILKELPEGEINFGFEGPRAEQDLEIKARKQKLKLKQKTSVFQLMELNVEDFPVCPSFHVKNTFKINHKALEYLIESTLYCASVDETRYHLTGVFFEAAYSITEKREEKKQGKEKEYFFRFVATDGHRLGLAEYPCGEEAKEVINQLSQENSEEVREKEEKRDKEGGESLSVVNEENKKTEIDNRKEKNKKIKGVIISKKGVQEIKKLISHSASEESVEVEIASSRILFRYGSTVLSVKLVEGSYPNYQLLMPKISTVSLTLDTEKFSQTLRRVSLLSSNRFKGVNIQIEEKKVQIKAENPELGSAQDEIVCQKKEGENLRVRFNARYILEALNAISSKSVLIEFRGAEDPCILRPIWEKEKKEEKTQKQRNIGVVMPMKI